jgi:hypothetical protein
METTIWKFGEEKRQTTRICIGFEWSLEGISRLLIMRTSDDSGSVGNQKIICKTAQLGL